MAFTLISPTVQAAADAPRGGAGAVSRDLKFDSATDKYATGGFFKDSESLEEALKRQNEFPAVCLLNLHLTDGPLRGKTGKGTATLLAGDKYIITAAHNLAIPFGDTSVVCFYPKMGIVSGKDHSDYPIMMSSPLALIKPGRVWIFPTYLAPAKRSDTVENDLAIAEIEWVIKPPAPLGIGVAGKPLDKAAAVGRNGFMPCYCNVGVWGEKKQSLQRFLSTYRIHGGCNSNSVYSVVEVDRTAVRRMTETKESHLFEGVDKIEFPSDSKDRLCALLQAGASGAPFITKHESACSIAGLNSAIVLFPTKHGFDVPTQVVMLFTAEHLAWIDAVTHEKLKPNGKMAAH